MKTNLFLASAAVTTLFSLGVPAFAATTNHVTVRRGAYLLRAPRLHSGRIALEKAGESLTVINGSTSAWWHVRDSHGRVGYITRNSKWTVVRAPKLNRTSSRFVANSRANTTTRQLPPGVRYDPTVHALAGLNASYQVKFDAVLKVAKSKLGTPYRWGHNEDRGQYGFDCSNFTAYVYHHALGYKMSGASQVQYHRVGWVVPKNSMRPGDLLIFNRGGHCGIYIGHGEMIEEGGGLGKVGYLKVSPGSYWYKHLTVVKRMF
ncbi:NlpC/P60 family protein [Alicyclobacillus tolerans]|uniref:NlpC/P60 family protein n=1 Tax=Alicyclobacillus tolerans TaxID=90970 RepID=UPI001F446262|nr:NlpC/P60 family protein [Alicyclobacillus tolerans]MCF8567132.1 NlpC/P60 family protein [Alicyclobacillus tolerans]